MLTLPSIFRIEVDVLLKRDVDVNSVVLDMKAGDTEDVTDITIGSVGDKDAATTSGDKSMLAEVVADFTSETDAIV